MFITVDELTLIHHHQPESTVRSMVWTFHGLDMFLVTPIYHYSVTQSSFTAPKKSFSVKKKKARIKTIYLYANIFSNGNRVFGFPYTCKAPHWKRNPRIRILGSVETSVTLGVDGWRLGR